MTKQQKSTKETKIGDKTFEAIVCEDGSIAIPVNEYNNIIKENELPVVIILTKQGYHVTCYDVRDIEAALNKINNKSVVSLPDDLYSDSWIDFICGTPII
jgi:TPP-dependent 2-oxoacid decarboxylase